MATSKRIFGALLILIGLVVGLALPVTGTVPETFTICHAAGLEGTTQFVELNLPFPAVFGEAGHFFENGTPRAGHEQDILGPCPVVTTTTAEETTTSEEVTSTTLVTTTSEETTLTTVGSTPPSSAPTTVGVNPICIDCNNATQADLMQLTGVDAPLALAIIANRPYETLQDLVNKGVMTGPQLLLILVINLNTGAFAGPECLNAVGATTTTVVVSVPGNPTTSIIFDPVTTTVPGVLPFTGSDMTPIAGIASGVLGLGLMLVGWTMRKEDVGSS